ncbi:MAG: oligosaccharide flippase family protein [Pseudomonadota bacterium]
MTDMTAAPIVPPQSRLARIASPFAVGVTARIGSQIISFALVVIAARFLSLEEFGVYALAAAAAVIGATFVYTGFYHAILRSSDFAKQIDTLFWLQILTGALCVIGILATALAFGGVSTDLGTALFVAAPLPLLAVLTAWNEAQMVREARARAASLYALAAEAAGLVAAIWLLAQGWGIFALLGARYVTTFVGLVLSTALVRRLPRLRFRPETVQESGRTAVPLWGTSAIAMFTNYGADFVLAAFLSPAAVGAFRSGSRIATTASDVIFKPLHMLSWSRFARLEQDGCRAEIGAAWCVNMSFACAMLWPVMAGVVLIAEDLVVTVFDPSWAAAAPVLAILCIGRAVSVPQALLEPALMCVNRPGLQVALRLGSGVALLVALLTLGRFGATEAAIAVALAMAATGAVTLFAIVRVLHLSLGQLAGTFVPGLLLSAGVGGSVLLLAPLLAPLPTAHGVIVDILVGALIWAAGMAVFTKAKVLEVPKP